MDPPPSISPKRKQKMPMANIFAAKTPAPPSSSIPSSSPAFGTPVHPLKPFKVSAPSKHAILPIILPPATLRPLAFRTFTKKHSLTLSSTALQELATFIGRHCGSSWREEGLAEKVLEEVAKSWKNRNGGVIVDGASPELKDILKTLEGNMSGGKIVTGARGLSRQNSLLNEPGKDADMSNTRLGLRPAQSSLVREDSQQSFGMSSLGVEEEDDEDNVRDPRKWLNIIDAYDQPRFSYNVAKKHFERETSKPSLLPPAAHKTALFRNRYNVIHQRLLRNESFQTSAVASARAPSLKRSASNQLNHKITPIANLLGRHGSHHMLLGMLNILPAGGLAISDLSATIALDVSQAVAIPEDSAWFSPGMIVLVDGVYEEEEESVGKGLSGSSGVGGTLGGRFQAFFIGQPPCEKRKATLGVSGPDGGQDHTIGGGFGWIDFLGVGSERAVGFKMRKLEQRLLPRHSAEEVPSRGRMVILGELNLDQPRSLQALRRILTIYAAEPEGATPMSFVITGNFTQHAVLARGGSGGSIEYKEYFDALASTLSEFPALLQTSTFVFVPGDNDGWVSSFTAGAATPLPRKGAPDVFTSRIRRVFAAANAEVGSKSDGEAIWTSNPSRMTLFGPNHEVVVFRDDISARLRRAAVRLKTPKQSRGQDEENQVPEAEDGADDVVMGGSGPIETAAEEEAMDVDIPSKKPAVKQVNSSVPQDVHTARKLVKTVLDQGYLSPFRQSIRPVHWDYATALHLYPLPTSMVLVDTTAPPFCVTYEGCHVMNPGSILVPGRTRVGRWIEYEIGKIGKLRETTF
ncbi:DNA polymerase alpha/epsilon subunit B [Colletotrichum higginsianum IMI 349063]|uniref:DNA polymerase epsilon subunit B n=1 Tax=Colletotrichum higginsianum (strain IMI 349063) TaxID=759273 RepID=A0A1B7Y600_COLHI|nr:DNA polymerase alpha/epsilon subunit B [Colletotrichum higginsianum IMI 349063]OBR07433.1 DNA polymerase alpha/epsilon subunit B [Colletotrichum higginsianum IMI 349063]